MAIGTIPLDLTYSTAIHRAERWSAVRTALDRHVLGVRRRAPARRRFGLGLHLAGRAALDLDTPGALAELRDWLVRHDAYVFTMNGGVYGRFTGQPLKSAAYRPDWLDEERIRHADRLALLLAALLPPDGFGTVNTIGGAFRARVRSRVDDAAIADRFLRHVALLARVRERTGKTIALAIEPEPACRLETIGETIAFFDRHLHGRAAVARVAALAGMTTGQAADAIARHLGVCLDASHAALEFDEPSMALRAFELAGVAVEKIQLSTALRLRYPFDRQAREALHAMLTDGTMHQAIARTPRELRRFADLPLALADPPPDADEWRVNAHLPLTYESGGALPTSQAAVATLLSALDRHPTVRHLEIDATALAPGAMQPRASELVDTMVRDLAWAEARLPHALARSA